MPKYTATVRNVTEFLLRGRGPDGPLQLLGCATRYMGIPFRELSLSAGGPETYDLRRAWNSVRFFAWVEKCIFKTPYEHAVVEIRDGFSVPGAVTARMGESALPVEAGDDGWEGAITLPGDRVFYAKLEGASQTRAWDPAVDTLRLEIPGEFQPERWQWRTGAVHARSKTYRR